MDNSNAAFNPRYFGEPSQEHSSFDQSIFERLSNYKKKYLVSFIHEIPPEGVLLDLGCGKGKTIRLVRFLRPDVKIIATDITDMTDFLPEGVDFHVASVDETGSVCADTSVDAIICEHVIEHVVYPNKMFEGMFNALKHGGKVFIETPNWTRLFLPFSPLYFWNDYTHIHPYSVMALRRAFMEYAFEEVYVRSVSSVDFGKRFLRTRIENGTLKTGLKPMGRVFKPKDSLGRKVFNAFLDLTIHPCARDILLGVARKP